MPSTSPHMVENGSEPSITVSFTYYTDATRRRELLYRGNARLRKLGVEPSQVGTSPTRDYTKSALLSAYTAGRSGVMRMLGRGIRDNTLPYAPA